MRLKQLFPLVLLLMFGCATRPKEIQPRATFPADGLITQRAVLTAGRRQFTLNGYLSLSAVGGKRLIITENFGKVLADVLVKPDGTVHVMRSSEAFRSAWIERYVAADLQCIFGGTPKKDCRVRTLSPKHFVIERFWYTLHLQIVDVKAGAQPAATFDAIAATP